jgi:hypothetical protein
MKNKRFQDSSFIVKIWRYRYYLVIPFKYFWFNHIKPMKVIETMFNEESGFVEDTDNIHNPKGKELWSILIGRAQHKMKWYWTSEEVFNRIKEKYEK